MNDRGMTRITVRDPEPDQEKLSGRQREPTALTLILRGGR
ncbi:Uncharacterised protein [Amycolatopsis camponoti]|uniref:Uncharacterized protein n=1 Tax=Amycolatopsis camponoti TaxID=2606593 RepID=A0A6I8LVE1_9PSEU|nr:Uncharacterised protein [Amycolatopsis camponoti]